MRRLQRYIVKGGKCLRMGYTTGSCAAAAARAAAMLLLTGKCPEAVRISTPGGEDLLIDVEEQALEADRARCAVCKDSGDDPDVTDGAVVGCTVSRIPEGFEVDGGTGVGRVTKPGLACAPGESAINPVPHRMIGQQLRMVAVECAYPGGLRAVVDVPDGERLAAKTFNPRLGIVGGISILGTTGIIEPMSEAALVATIHAEIDRVYADGARTMLLVPGNYGADFAREAWGLSLSAGVKCSNFIGEAVDYACWKGFRRILLLGHAGKLVKLAASVMNTHSHVADCRMEVLAAHGAICGLGPDRVCTLMDCVTVDAADALLCEWGVADGVWNGVAQRAAACLQRRAGADVDTAFAAFARRGVVMRYGNIESMRDELMKDKRPVND